MSCFAGTAARLARRRLATMLHNAADPLPAQQRLLGKLMARMGPTGFGRQHGLARGARKCG